MELSDDIYNKILQLTDKGDIFIKKNKLIEALYCFKKALELIPDPKYDWEASTWIYTALGDVYFIKKEYENALYSFREAKKCPRGFANPFILLRMGQSFFETNNIDKAKENLLGAYMLEGEDLFKHEMPKYFNTIKDLINNQKKQSKFSLFIKRIME